MDFWVESHFLAVQLWISKLYIWSGWVCVLCLGMSLAIPKFKSRNLQKLPIKKIFGILAFFVAFLHCCVFVVLDFGCDFALILAELSQKHYLYFGLLSLLCLLICMIGSFGCFWKWKLFWLVYLSLIFALMHWILAQKILTFWILCVSIGIVLLIAYKLLVFKRIKKHNPYKA